MLGPSGVKVVPSPGSRHFQMKRAPSNHWLLPISNFNSLKGKEVKKMNKVLATTPE